MDTRLLKIFVAIYEEKNLSRAAEKCFVSQPNISSGLKQLEETIGKKLFIRTKRGVEIKEEAHYLYPIAKRLVGELDSIPEMFSLVTPKTKIVVGVADSLPQQFKSNFFKQASEILNDVEWDIRPIHRDCDINLLIREWKFEDHIFLSLGKEEYVLCIPDGHPLSKKQVIEVEELGEEPFIHCPPCEAHQQTLAILNNNGKKWNTVANCQNKNEVLTLLISGLGITFLPEYFAKGWDGFQIKPYTGPKNFREIGVSYGQKSMKDPNISKLITALSKLDPLF